MTLVLASLLRWPPPAALPDWQPREALGRPGHAAPSAAIALKRRVEAVRASTAPLVVCTDCQGMLLTWPFPEVGAGMGGG